MQGVAVAQPQLWPAFFHAPDIDPAISSAGCRVREFPGFMALRKIASPSGPAASAPLAAGEPASGQPG